MIPDLRIIESEIGPVVPVNEVAKQIGCGRATISNTVHKPENAALFAPYLLTVRVKGKAGYRDRLCITKEGLDELIAHMRPIQKDNRSMRIGKFRESLRDRHIANDVPALSDVLTEYGKRARALATKWGVDLAVARRVVMADAVEKYPDLTPYRALVGGDKPQDAICALPDPGLPKADPDFERYFPLPKIAEMCKCDEEVARRILEDAGIIGFANRHTTLSTRGSIEDFGKVFTCYPYFPHRMTPRGHIRYNSDKCCHLIREKLFGIQAPLSEFQRVPPSKGG